MRENVVLLKGYLCTNSLDDTIAVACVLSNWGNVLQAISMAFSMSDVDSFILLLTDSFCYALRLLMHVI